ncbi:molybdenum cofactor guanylyltransferase [Sporomusa sphaeroides]|uniref:molybdenum cofactor guanylyltransferase n=1 Tax=Sporomusa sphaeroides TaxID=47679 RepID=UPI002B9A659C|nr:molybdenum cofactor guanylyltransferase [Sporomusa sphaeroides]HML32005.1 molybdenum cofactor guanylyltransferase [Sporomusa sphaeroides]
MGLKEATAIILAGGNSTRMGRDKATLPWGNSNILNYLAMNLMQVCREVIVVSNRPRDVAALVRVVPDIIPHRGPLGGIHSGLCHATYAQAVIVGCDMPFVRPEVVRILLDKMGVWDAVVPIYGGRPQPLLAAYSKECIPLAEELLKNQEYKVLSLLAKVKCSYVKDEWSSIVAPEILFQNLNTIEDYVIMRKYAESR